MAIIWQFSDAHTRYEVRSAGSSIRLYTNGAFHTQYSPKNLFTGGVWDLLSIPALFTALQSSPEVLMLGVGGGSAIHQLQTLLQPKTITGIELNPVHIEIAKTFFKLKSKNIKLIEADALTWVNRSKKRFDVLIDDLFIDSTADPVRPFKCDEQWINQLDKSVKDKGLLIQNHLKKSDALASATISKRYFQSALLFTTPQYENVVVALYRQKVDARTGRLTALNTIKQIEKKSLRRLEFKVQKIY